MRIIILLQAWNKRQFTASDHFEIQMAFKVTGQGRIGADGLALWYGYN